MSPTSARAKRRTSACSSLVIFLLIGYIQYGCDEFTCADYATCEVPDAESTRDNETSSKTGDSKDASVQSSEALSSSTWTGMSLAPGDEKDAGIDASSEPKDSDASSEPHAADASIEVHDLDAGPPILDASSGASSGTVSRSEADSALAFAEAGVAIALPVISEFNASDESLHAGEFTTLTWTAEGAESFTLSPGGLSFDASVNSTTVQLAQSTTFTLVAKNRNGETTRSLRVPLTSRGEVSYITYLGAGDAFDVVYDAANDRVISMGSGSLEVDGASSEWGPFVAANDRESGQVLDVTPIEVDGSEPPLDPSRLAIGALGDVYVAGSQQLDFEPFTLRLASDLTRTADADLIMGDGYDYLPTITAFPSGSIVAAGYTDRGFSSAYNGQTDGFVVSYNRELDRQEIVEIGTPFNDWILASAAGIDGDLFVGGETLGELPGFSAVGDGDAFIARVKADDLNDYTILSQFGTTSYDSITCIGIDSLGSIIVAGRTGGSLGTGQAFEDTSDVFVAKFDPGSSSPQWSTQIATPEYETAWDVALDDADNIIVVGSTEGNINRVPGGHDLFAVQLSPDGEVIWKLQLGTPGSDSARSVDVDNRGNIYLFANVAGALPNGTGMVAEGRNIALIQLH